MLWIDEHIEISQFCLFFVDNVDKLVDKFIFRAFFPVDLWINLGKDPLPTFGNGLRQAVWGWIFVSFAQRKISQDLISSFYLSVNYQKFGTKF